MPYTKLSLEELQAEQQKLQSQKTMMNIIVGLFLGLAIYAATHHTGFLFTVGLLAFPWWVARKRSEKLAQLQAEIDRRKA